MPRPSRSAAPGIGRHAGPLADGGHVLAPVAATFGNSYELRIGTLLIPGFYLLDGIKGSITNLIQVSAFWIGSRFLSSPIGRVTILKVLVAAMLVYSLPMLFEVRFSPQLQRIVYGYAGRDFITQVRRAVSGRRCSCLKVCNWRCSSPWP